MEYHVPARSKKQEEELDRRRRTNPRRAHSSPPSPASFHGELRFVLTLARAQDPSHKSRAYRTRLVMRMLYLRGGRGFRWWARYGRGFSVDFTWNQRFWASCGWPARGELFTIYILIACMYLTPFSHTSIVTVDMKNLPVSPSHPRLATCSL
jgi:hypothetical protein